MIFALVILSGLILNPSLPGNRTEEVILEKATEALQADFDSEAYRLEVAARWIPSRLLKISPERIQAVNVEGRVERFTNFQVSFRQDDHYRNVEIQLAVEIEQKLPVANRRIMSGEVINAGDLDQQWIPVTRKRGQMVTDENRLIGKTLRRTLLPGQPVRSTDISRKYIVEAGDRVKLIFKENGIRIEIAGEALQNGAKDDEIKIYSKETRKKYLGRIVSPGVAKWEKTE